MKNLRFLLAFVAVVGGAIFPPTAYAEVVCNTYTFRTIIYDPNSGLRACGSWAYHNCTECADTETGDSCLANGGPCEITPKNPEP